MTVLHDPVGAWSIIQWYGIIACSENTVRPCRVTARDPYIATIFPKPSHVKWDAGSCKGKRARSIGSTAQNCSTLCRPRCKPKYKSIAHRVTSSPAGPNHASSSSLQNVEAEWERSNEEYAAARRWGPWRVGGLGVAAAPVLRTARAST